MTLDATTRFVTALMKRDTDALGFLPASEVARRAERGRVLLCSDNDEPCGYAVLGFNPDWVPLHQVCVARDARRLEHGRDLVEQAARLARQRGALGLRLRCAEDLPANAFWRALGFEPVRIERPKNRRGRGIVVYVMPTAEAGTLLPFGEQCPMPKF